MSDAEGRRVDCGSILSGFDSHLTPKKFESDKKMTIHTYEKQGFITLSVLYPLNSYSNKGGEMYEVKAIIKLQKCNKPEDYICLDCCAGLCMRAEGTCSHQGFSKNLDTIITLDMPAPKGGES